MLDDVRRVLLRLQVGVGVGRVTCIDGFDIRKREFLPVSIPECDLIHSVGQDDNTLVKLTYVVEAATCYFSCRRTHCPIPTGSDRSEDL